MTELIEKLALRLQGPLPGRVAQLQMAHVTRQRYVDAPTNARRAAVLMALFPKHGEWNIILIERPANDRDQHSGQLSFPGGKVEPQDPSLLHTALREAEEEVGIAQQQVKILGGLTELYIPVSNFQVYPFLGYLETASAYRVQAGEVSQVLEIPLSHFQRPEIRATTDIRVNQHITLKHVPYFQLQQHVLWGATAMMLNELLVLAFDA